MDNAAGREAGMWPPFSHDTILLETTPIPIEYGLKLRYYLETTLLTLTMAKLLHSP